MKILRKRRRLVLGLALGLLATSVLAAPAQAKPDHPNGVTLGVAVDDEALFRGSDKPAWWNYETIPYQTNTIPNVPDGRAEHRTFGGGPQSIPVATSDSEFSWRDAGFGAVGATALLALMAGMALTLRRRQGDRLATP